MNADPLFKVDKLSITSALVGFAGMFALLELTEDPADANSLNSVAAPPPEAIDLTGTVRDFRERAHPDGHPDFEREPDLSWGHYIMNVAPTLGTDGKPEFTGGGRKVAEQWTDERGAPICWCVPRQAGDVKGRAPSLSDGGIESADSFAQWFNDDPGVNESDTLTVTLMRQSNGMYVYDHTQDPRFSSKGGFFPIDGKLLDDAGDDRNFHFTYELHTRFAYDSNGEQVFRFIGDDDVWVFIDGNLVIDLGGVHSATEQRVDLDRLGLEHGQVYTLAFFFAERHRTQSNFRIETNIPLTTDEVPAVAASLD